MEVMSSWGAVLVNSVLHFVRWVSDIMTPRTPEGLGTRCLGHTWRLQPVHSSSAPPVCISWASLMQPHTGVAHSTGRVTQGYWSQQHQSWFWSILQHFSLESESLTLFPSFSQGNSDSRVRTEYETTNKRCTSHQSCSCLSILRHPLPSVVCNSV